MEKKKLLSFPSQGYFLFLFPSLLADWLLGPPYVLVSGL